MRLTMLAATLGVAVLITACAATETRRSTGQVFDDTSISTRLKSRLLADPITDGLDIEVEVNRGRVQLIGFADSAEERERAGEIARSISGVASVDNSLSVATGSRRVGEYVDDKVLVTRVKTALTKDPIVKAREIEVEVNRRIVALGGFVDNRQERGQAEKIALAVPGVSSVVNNIEVR